MIAASTLFAPVCALVGLALAGPRNGVPATNAAAWAVYAVWAVAAAAVTILVPDRRDV